MGGPRLADGGEPAVSRVGGAGSGAGGPAELPPLTLRANFSWTFAGNAVYAASQWGIVVLIAKTLSSEALGRFALALAITAPIVLLTNLQLRAVQATDAQGEYRFGDYLAVRITTTALALSVIGIAGTAIGGQAGAVIVIVGLAKGAEAMSDIGYGLLQYHERMDWIGRSMMLRGVLSVGLIAAVLASGRGLTGVAAALAAGFTAVLVLYDVRQVRRMLAATGGPAPAPVWDGRRMARLSWLALPLGLAVALVSLTSNVPRYVIDTELGAADLGVFAAIAYLIVAGTTVVTALGQAASPRLAKYHAAGARRAYVRLVARLVGIGLGMGALAMGASAVAGRPLLRLLYEDEYARLDVLLWLMAAATALFVAAFLGYAMTAARRFRPQLPLFAATAGVAVVASLAFVPAMGLTGAGLALVISATVQIAGSATIVLAALPGRAAPGTT